MRKNKMMRLASGLLVAVLLTTSMISGTFAKYVAQFDAEDTAKVAKFDVEAFGKNVATADTATIDLFATSAVLDTLETGDTSEFNANDADIADGAVAIIAPGSYGKVAFDVENKSEVTVKYTVTYDVDEDSVPLEWSVNGTTWTDSLENVAATELAIPTGENEDDVKDTITIYWRWAFEGSQASSDTVKNLQNDNTDANSDTALGLAGNATPRITITVDFTQVD